MGHIQKSCITTFGAHTHRICFMSTHICQEFAQPSACCILLSVNPFKLNGISHSYQLDYSISSFKVVWWCFSFLFKF